MTVASPDRLTYVGHATVLIEICGVRLLTDPVLRPSMLGVIRRHPAAPSSEVAEGVDAVLISHLHHDHLDFASLKRIGTRTEILVPAGAGPTFRRRGFVNLTELGVGETASVGCVEVTATPAEHEGRRYKLGPRIEAVGYDIRGCGRRVYFAGDTDIFAGMEALSDGIDVALLPIAGWGPRLGRGHLDPRTAAEAAALLRPRFVVPIHWGTLLRAGLGRRTTELLERPPRRFVDELATLAPDVRGVVLEPGGMLELSP